MPDDPSVATELPGTPLNRRRLVASSFVRSVAEVGESAAAGVRLGFDVQVIRKKQASGGWTVYLYRRPVES